ncbi:protein translocase subunit SecD [Candidatus Kaiserbacteria bacterium]|nr:protein translocase subunit SecD [Candidatus Kaiserbacteria bacterium]
MKQRMVALLVLLAGVGIGYFVYAAQMHGFRPFRLGLDLSGGTHLVYDADTSKLSASEVPDSLSALQAVIVRRVDSFGVSEPVVQTERGGALGTGGERLIVELPGITDVNEAIKLIGQTPVLEFKLVKPGMANSMADKNGVLNPTAFEDTGLTGKYVQHAALQFGNGSSALPSEATVALTFDSAGAKIFSDLTTAHVGDQLAIFLDGNMLSAPVIQTAINDGTAIISGHFTPDEAKQMVKNLNLGALPVPITLASTQTIGATLGDEALHAGVFAGIIGFLILSLFMILWYRVPGIVAVVSLVIYATIMLALFQLVPVVLTAAGMAAFILSVGLAVDANILIAERIKEELAAGRGSEDAIREGFARAWLAIRDSNIAHIIASIILFWLGTSIIKGFALVFGLGVLVSMFSAITVSRTFLLALGINTQKRVGRFFMSSGIK